MSAGTSSGTSSAAVERASVGSWSGSSVVLLIVTPFCGRPAWRRPCPGHKRRTPHLLGGGGRRPTIAGLRGRRRSVPGGLGVRQHDGALGAAGDVGGGLHHRFGDRG